MSKRNRDKGRSPQFVKVYPYVMRCDAWKITSKGARLLFIALKVNYSSNFQNNGRVYLSKRRAEEEFGLSHSNVTRWYRELQHYRFIVQTQRPYLGVEGRGKPAKWRLTDEPYNGEPATNDFLKWDGVLFEPEPKTESRTSGKSTPDLPQVHQWTSGKSTPAKSGPMVSPNGTGKWTYGKSISSKPATGQLRAEGRAHEEPE